MIENWIDAVQKVWAGISPNGFGTVQSPLLIEKAEFPSAIDPLLLMQNPLALTIPADFKFVYSAGGPNEGFYQGVTEFHVAPNVDKSWLPSLLQFPRLIVQAAAANLTLGGLVHHWTLQDRDDQISGPLELQYGDENPHWGFLVHWEVKEQLNSSITVATGD